MVSERSLKANGTPDITLVGFLFSSGLDPIRVQFLQVTFYFFERLCRASPFQKSLRPEGRVGRGIHTPFIWMSTGISDQSFERTSWFSRRAWIPLAVIVKKRFLLPPRSEVAPPIFEWRNPFSSRRLSVV